MNIYLTGLLWVGGAVIVTALLAFLIRRYGKGDDDIRDANNEASGGVFTIVAGLHAVLIAFILIALFDTVADAETASYTEADGLVAATWAGEAISPEVGDEVRSLSRAYSITVINDEWPAMREGEESSDTGWDQLDRLRKVVAEAPAEDSWRADRKTEAANQLWHVYQARQERLDAASGGVSAVMWFVLGIGTVLAIFLPLLFGSARTMRTHIIITCTLAATLTLLLYATYQLQNPFAGGADVTPEAFQAAVARFG
ncbi:bestrophin-like domain [Saccharothrix yanglingensis]|uniref:DUF4239 domain-containing protein n=1 Tax=Saccharothrix yanglingensis TaxID=659496 RepID=A0ABU0WX00_9PSEU|nr:hypothetical protein [Saccharothrix yanglingensis]MDQ2584346.1 hypothetical protein [Saccharothrix yanglingensis]